MGWQSFTPRSIAFAAFALALYVTGLLTGVPELFMVAVATISLPLLAFVVVRLGRFRVTSRRAVRPSRATVGGKLTVELALDNLGRLETGILLVEDTLPAQLHGAARFVVPGIPGGASTDLTYTVGAATRGRARIGPLVVRLSDPFDLVQTTSRLAGASEIVVHPRVEALSAPALGGELRSTSATRVRRLYTQGEEFYTTREYRAGDDLRKVHWRSSAKRGELMIRQDESPWQARSMLAVDLRRGVHKGQGASGSLERTISVAASIAVRLCRSGYQVSLATDAGGQVRPSALRDPVTAILDFLAEAKPSRTPSLAPLASRLSRLEGEGLLVAVITVPTAEEAAALSRCRLAFSGGHAIIVRAETWGELGPRELAAADGAATGAIALLERAGWRVTTLSRNDSLEEQWQRLVAPARRSLAGPKPLR